MFIFTSYEGFIKVNLPGQLADGAEWHTNSQTVIQ